VKVSVVGSNCTSVFAPKSLTHTWSRSSTYTAYAWGLGPGNRHSRHSSLSGSKTASLPAFHSLTQMRPVPA
jgi:hypothetical protein